MSFDPVTAAFDIGGKLIDRIFPDPNQRAEALFKLNELKQSGELALLTAETDLAKSQTEINKIEAGSGDKFASRWRPFIGWVCGIAFAYHFVAQPLIAFVLASAGHNVELPSFDMDALNTVLLGMLGLGTMRSFERVKKVTK